MDSRKEVVKRLKGEEDFYPIIELCKDDLRGLFQGNKKAIGIIDNMGEDELKYFFSKFVNVLESTFFWDTLKSCFEDRYVN